MKVVYLTPQLLGDPSRLVARPFLPGGANFVDTTDRLDQLVGRVTDIPDEVAASVLADLKVRHRGAFADLEDSWRQHFAAAAQRSEVAAAIELEDRQLLVGAYLTQPYAYEAAALTNPSIVPFGEVENGRQPFVMSARAIGEGHISSITFVTGSVGPSGDVEVDRRHPHAASGRRTTPRYSKPAFVEKLLELGFMTRTARNILDSLPPMFDTHQLELALGAVRDRDLDRAEAEVAAKRIHWLADSNYDLAFGPNTEISSHLIAPAAPAESRGMEDARFVRFIDDDGSITYYATYTAFDGISILPQLIQTSDFYSFRIATMSGPAVHHKGMALFPRRIGGDLVALSRHDHERLFLLRSDNVRSWTNAEVVLGPEHEWEAVQTGNCGSPIETDAGWLVITHGVGPMRRYCLGAVLLDIEEPTKVLGRLRQPLLEPREEQRFGYVPDVVYSCGSLVHDGQLVIPYGFADVGIGFAVTRIDELIAAMS